jgi:hypothetical protein
MSLASTLGSIMDDHDGDYDIGDVEVAFLRGVFAAKGITNPTEEEFHDAMGLLHLHAVEWATEPH